MRLFFRTFFCRQTVPLQVFWYFAANWSFKKLKGSPLSSFSALWDFQNSHFSIFWIFFKKFSNFSFVAKRSPFKFFDISQQTEVSKSTKGPPFLVFGTVRLFQNSHFSFFRKFFQKNFRIFLLSPSIFLIFCNRLDFQKTERVPFYKFKNLALFWALEIAPTLDVPVLLVNTESTATLLTFLFFPRNGCEKSNKNFYLKWINL